MQNTNISSNYAPLNYTNHMKYQTSSEPHRHLNLRYEAEVCIPF